MSFFTSADFDIFDEASASDAALDDARAHVRNKLAWLHQQIYPEMRARRWDLHSYWQPQWLISPARISSAVPRIDSMTLRYSKPETVVRLMKKEFGEDFSKWFANALLGITLDPYGVSVELFVSHKAWADGQNFKNKLLNGAPQKRHLRQLLAEMGGGYSLHIAEPPSTDLSLSRTEIARASCSRLINLGALNATLAEYQPGAHDLKIARTLAQGDERADAETLAAEVLFRLGQLYPLYQFVTWLPRNDYLPRSSAAQIRTESNL